MPKIRTFDFEVEGTPAEVAARLHRHLSLGAEKAALRGSSRPDGFEISFAPRPLSGKLRAVAQGTFHAAGAGRTRVVGRCEPPRFFIWYFRVAILVLCVFLGYMGWTIANDIPLVALPVMLWLPLMLGIPILGIGFNLWTANAEVDPLLDAIYKAYALTADASAARAQEIER